MCFVSVFLVGLDGQFVSERMFTFMCTLRKWVLSIGFTLGYGAMFSKVWRVHRLTTKNKSATKVVSKKLMLESKVLTLTHYFCSDCFRIPQEKNVGFVH